jgi:hypothetical protein
MITYAVVNLKEKVKFEKKYQLSYGYNNIPLFGGFGSALRWFNSSLGPNERKEFIIERHEAGKCHIVFKI